MWELRKRENISYLAFLDVSKAYDSLLREEWWRKMRYYGVEEKYARVCEGLYNEGKMRVAMNGAKSKRFRVERGFRQGCLCLHLCLIFL